MDAQAVDIIAAESSKMQDKLSTFMIGCNLVVLAAITVYLLVVYKKFIKKRKETKEWEMGGPPTNTPSLRERYSEYADGVELQNANGSSSVAAHDSVISTALEEMKEEEDRPVESTMV